MKRTAKLTVLLTPEELADLREIADWNGHTISQEIREILRVHVWVERTARAMPLFTPDRKRTS